MADESGPFEIEPCKEPTSDDPNRPSPPSERQEPKAQIDAESLLEGFDEDADFSSDPEVEAVLEAAAGKPKKRDRSGEAELGDPSNWLIRPGFPSIQVSLIAGGVLLLLAVGFSIANAEDQWWLHALVTIYMGVFSTLLGLFAFVAASYFCERGLNEPALAMARMCIPVGGAMASISLQLPYALSFPLAGGVYYLLAMVCFRLPRFELHVLAISHFGLWLLVRVGIELSSRVI